MLTVYFHFRCFKRYLHLIAKLSFGQRLFHNCIYKINENDKFEQFYLILYYILYMYMHINAPTFTLFSNKIRPNVKSIVKRDDSKRSRRVKPKHGLASNANHFYYNIFN